jgi:hypothetical protein
MMAALYPHAGVCGTRAAQQPALQRRAAPDNLPAGASGTRAGQRAGAAPSWYAAAAFARHAEKELAAPPPGG